jgi:hypothetical protein
MSHPNLKNMKRQLLQALLIINIIVCAINKHCDATLDSEVEILVLILLLFSYTNMTNLYLLVNA